MPWAGVPAHVLSGGDAPPTCGCAQVAEKFLERDELASMSFQNDFLTPFVVVMRQSGAKEIRELIIRQASRMVLSRVTNIKSGWKSMFMV